MIVSTDHTIKQIKLRLTDISDESGVDRISQIELVFAGRQLTDLETVQDAHSP